MRVRTNWKWIALMVTGIIILLSIVALPTILIMWALDMIKFKLIIIPIAIFIFIGWIVNMLVISLSPEEYRELFNKDKQ